MGKLKKIVVSALIVGMLCACTGCGLFDSEVNELNGTIKGNTYNISFYSNEGEKFMEMSGQKIDMNSNTVEEPTYTDSGWGYTQTLSSVVTITVDGKEVESCGTTMLFAENGLSPDVDFTQPDKINSKTDGKLSDNTIIAKTVNKYKNYFGKSRIVVIQSQLGDPICAYSGDEVYWKVCKDLPKTTKLMVDGKALYIHRANFQIIDIALLK